MFVIILLLIPVVYSAVTHDISKISKQIPGESIQRGAIDTSEHYIYGVTGKEASISNNGIKYYHSDHLGSNSLVTESNGELEEENKYLPFGENLDSSEERFTFTGKETDKSGLQYTGARYYDQDIGRFTTVDPIKSGMNHYVYTDNNPLKYVDPSGLDYYSSLSNGNYNTEVNLLRLGNVGVGAGLSFLTGSMRGDSNEDMIRNSLAGAASSLLSFELRRRVGSNGEPGLSLLGAGFAADILSSVQANAMAGEDLFSSVTLNYMFVSATFEDDGDWSVGINVLRLGELLSPAVRGDNLDLGASLTSGVTVFNSINRDVSGECGAFGGYVSYNEGDSVTFRHESVHSLQMRYQQGIGRGLLSATPYREDSQYMGLADAVGSVALVGVPFSLYQVTAGLSSDNRNDYGHYYSRGNLREWEAWTVSQFAPSNTEQQGGYRDPSYDF